jgi:murein L,D-transpeptidase YcbB/YkuD
MARTRRFFVRGLCGAAATMVPLAAGLPTPALASFGAEAAPPMEGAAAGLASLVRQAALSSPPPDRRCEAALKGTLARLESLAPLDHAQGRFVLANIAAAEVIAFEDGREVLRSRAIVGARRTPTPRLLSTVPFVRLNPPWYVPASIEPSVRALSGFRRVNGHLVQPPGPRNPLGPIRVGLVDSQAVFLHGTSQPRLFARGERFLSHGCVRVERIAELAAWVLGVPTDTLQAAVATRRTLDLVPPEEVRVALVYLTAWPGADGQLVFHPDPYGLDRPARHRPPRLPPPRPAEPEPAIDGAFAFDDPA